MQGKRHRISTQNLYFHNQKRKSLKEKSVSVEESAFLARESDNAWTRRFLVKEEDTVRVVSTE